MQGLFRRSVPYRSAGAKTIGQLDRRSRSRRRRLSEVASFGAARTTAGLAEDQALGRTAGKAAARMAGSCRTGGSSHGAATPQDRLAISNRYLRNGACLNL